MNAVRSPMNLWTRGNSWLTAPDRLPIVLAVVVMVVAPLTAAAGTWTGSLPVVLLGLAAIGAAFVTAIRQEMLMYAYFAAVPFNAVLPAGPAGTVARIAGLVF